MRTIKFQLVFDTAIGKYITKQSYTIEDFLNFRYGLDCLLEEETEEFGAHDHDAFFSYEPKLIAKRQSTGLLDKNMVEIYEGDVVTIKGDERKFYIRWFDDMCFAFADVRSDYVKTFYSCYDTSNGFPLDEWIEVIGNIYKHHYLPEENHD